MGSTMMITRSAGRPALLSTPRALLLSLALLGLLLAAPGCKGKHEKKSLLGTLAKEKGLDPDKAREQAKQALADKEEKEALAKEAASQAAAADANKKRGFKEAFESWKKDLLYCQRGHLEKFDYKQLNTGLPPVPVNAFDRDCKKPILKLYEEMDENWGGKDPAIDAFLADAALLADGCFMLSGMLKNLGTRRLSALVARMKVVQAESIKVCDASRKATPSTDEAAWAGYAKGLTAAHGTPEAAFEALKTGAEALEAFFAERILANIKKDQMVYYLAFSAHMEAWKKSLTALPTTARKAEFDALLADWADIDKLMEGNFQDRKGALLDKAKAIKKKTLALAKPPRK